MKSHKQFKFTILIISLCFLSLFVMGCGNEAETDKVEGKTYTATVKGYGGDVTVDVTVGDDGTINALNVDAPEETVEVGGKAATKIAKAIIAKQSLAVDTVSGATITSNAVISATESALKEAGVDTEALKKK